MAKKSKTNQYPEAQNPLMLRCHRLMEAFAKSDDERDFYLDNVEGFIIYVDLDKSQEELEALEQEIESNEKRYLKIPKLTFYESKKIMEGFVHEKVYDIDTKEKLLDIIQSKEARENFLEFIYDHPHELEKWQQFYQERSRVRIIEWLRSFKVRFVFEEDLDFSRKLLEKVKENLFEQKVDKDVQAARKMLETKCKVYYSSEALNPRPKRGRPPKQAAKTEIEPHVVVDIYTTVPSSARPFLFKPDISGMAGVTFSTKFETEDKLLAAKKGYEQGEGLSVLESLNQKLATLKSLSSKWMDTQTQLEKEKLDLSQNKEEEVKPKKKPRKTSTKKKA